MITREDLLKSSEYWIEIIQNKVYSDLVEYIEKHGASNKEIAKSLGISKGRVSQILSGDNLNFRLDTLVKLCLSIDKIPSFHLEDISKFIDLDLKESESIIFRNISNLTIPVAESQEYEASYRSENMSISPSFFYTLTKNIGTSESDSNESFAA